VTGARAWHYAAGKCEEDWICGTIGSRRLPSWRWRRGCRRRHRGRGARTRQHSSRPNERDGYVWEIPAGPATIRYTAVIKDGAWREVGDRIVPDKEPVRFFEINLKRVGDSSWPAAGAISPN
jgi:hypothetical protein